MISISRAFQAALLLCLGLLISSCDSSSYPDLVVHNANVITIDTVQPVAQAFAVQDGVFLLVGNDEDVLALAGPSTKIRDAGVSRFER